MINGLSFYYLTMVLWSIFLGKSPKTSGLFDIIVCTEFWNIFSRKSIGSIQEFFRGILKIIVLVQYSLSFLNFQVFKKLKESVNEQYTDNVNIVAIEMGFGYQKPAMLRIV